MNTAPAKPARSGRFPLVGLILLVLLWVVWGTSWPAMRTIFLEMPVWQFRAVSCAIGAVGLLFMGMTMGGRSWRVPRRLWGWLVVAGLLNITFWHVMTGFGLQILGAGHGAIVCYTMPVWVAMMSAAVLKEKIDARKIVALVLGMGAVVVLLSADFQSLGTSRLGIAFVLAAAMFWAAGTIVVKRFDWQVNMYALAGWQLVVGFFPMLAAALILEEFQLHTGSAAVNWSMAYIVFGAVIGGYALWFQLVRIFPPTVAAIGSLMVPVIGVASGNLFLAEPIGWREGVALACVLAAVALVVFQRQEEAAPDAAEADPADQHTGQAG